MKTEKEYTPEQATVYLGLISHDALKKLGIKTITEKWFECGGRIFLKDYNSCASMFAKNNSGGTDFYVWLQNNIRWVGAENKETWQELSDRACDEININNEYIGEVFSWIAGQANPPYQIDDTRELKALNLELLEALSLCIRCMDGARIPKYMEIPVKKAKAVIERCEAIKTTEPC